MYYTKEKIKAIIDDMRAIGMETQDIEDTFKMALKVKGIDVDTYFNAMQEIYGEV